MTNFQKITENVNELSEFLADCMEGYCENCPVRMERCSDWNSESEEGMVKCNEVFKRWLNMDFE